MAGHDHELTELLGLLQDLTLKFFDIKPTLF
jgi:hypothetical protein